MQFGYPSDSARLGFFSLASVLLLFALAGCQAGDRPPVIDTEIEFRPDGLLDFLDPDGEIVTRIVIEIADTDSAQARGLMDRRSLPARGGMLFVDPEPSERRFWMRNTPLPLDIIFVRSDSSIANIVKRTTPYSDVNILSEGLAQYVIELRAGFTDQYGITDSLTVSWERTE